MISRTLARQTEERLEDGVIPDIVYDAVIKAANDRAAYAILDSYFFSHAPDTPQQKARRAARYQEITGQFKRERNQ